MKELITSHLRGLIDEGNSPISFQFKKQKGERKGRRFTELDPLGEEAKYSPVKGLVHKYKHTALIKTSYYCAAHCQFCTRIRDIGTADGNLSKTDIRNIIEYIEKNEDIREVILSGGDPFVTPDITYNLLDLLKPIKHVRVVRIGTRLPVHDPNRFFSSKRIRDLLELIEKINRFTNPIHILIHFNHSDEITGDVERVIWELRQKGIMLFSQTVFLKSVNDNMEALENLFLKLHSLGVIPYYIYRCDYVKGLERFIVPFEEECRIMHELWKCLPGLALPQYIVDAPDGKGKIRVPSLAWIKKIPKTFTDASGKKIKI